MISLSTEKLFEIGNYISGKLIENNIQDTAILTINVDKESFKKIDEDVFYSFKKQNLIESEEFIPSEKEIDLTFPKLNILIESNS